MTTPAAHGQLYPFDSAVEDWKTFIERAELYFDANGITEDAKKRGILLSSCGPKTFTMIKSIVAPTRPGEIPYGDLEQLIGDHYNPKPKQTVQRCLFNSRNRKEGETVATFLTELKKLAEHCGFGATEKLEENLRDRLICGINNERWQKRLLAEDNPNFKRVYELALSMEAAEKSVDQLQGKSGHARVNKLNGGGRKSRPEGGPDSCYRCNGTNHKPSECRFKETTCHSCGKKGHISRACFSKHKQPQQQHQSQRQQHQQGDKRQPTGRTHHVETQPDGGSSDPEYPLYSITSRKGRPIIVAVSLNGTETEMEVDTGASFSLISEATYRKLWRSQQAPALKQSSVRLTTYTGEPVPILGAIDVTATVNAQTKDLALQVVQGDGPSLLGRDWLEVIQLDWPRIHQLQQGSEKWQSIVDRHSDVFKDELGHIKGHKVKLQLKPDAQPKFCRPRKVPYALKEGVENELDRMERDGVIEKITTSDWASPIVPAVKTDGIVRICGDYSLTVNRAAKTDTYPLPTIDDIYASLAGGKTFSKLDLAHAYNQIELDDDTKHLATINTTKGLYKHNRLPFGIASATAVFQKTMETILQGIPGVSVYIDDILVTGKAEEEHLQHLEEVLSRLEAVGARLRRSKCFFMLPSIEYLGHIISERGLQPTNRKVQAIQAAPAPTNQTQLKSFLGLINYYSKFLPNLSTILFPLYRLLQSKVPWQWEEKEQRAFETAKAKLTTDRVLAHYDPTKPIVLACDASPYGLGAVLSHVMENGEEKPVAFTSRSLAPAEKQYSQLDKEALAIIFGVKRFHQYLYGRPFTILSDHKPLEGLLKETKPIPAMASVRIQRWALTLAAYDYRIKFKRGQDNANADLLSRLPLPETPVSIPTPGETVLLMEALDSSVVTASHIKAWTARDPVLAKVKDMVLQGHTPPKVDDYKPYRLRFSELSIHDGCLLWGSRVIVPPKGREKMMEQLHESHPGITRIKALARSYVWWPNMDDCLEQKVRTCELCQLNRPPDHPVTVHPWEFPKKPWVRLHIDYAGPVMGKMFLVLIDAHSKWLEVKVVSSATSSVTMQHLRSIFSTHGLPEILVSDNGSCFTSHEFGQFMRNNGIRHICTAPYHPASNGQAERAVKIVKQALKNCTKDAVETQLSRFLFHYRLTPQTTTGVSPAELLLRRRPRSQLDLAKPDLHQHIASKQTVPPPKKGGGKKEATLGVDSPVLVRNFGTGHAVLVSRHSKAFQWAKILCCRVD